MHMSNAEHTTRDTLQQRIMPEITLSDKSNPLTTFIPLPNVSPKERAVRRFAIEGNAIVTGGAGFMGLSISRAFLEHGLSGLAIFDIPSAYQTASDQLKELQNDFPNAKIVTKTVDVTDEAAIEAAVEETTSLDSGLGNITTLVCLAGIVSCVHAIDTSPSSWRKVLEVNATGSWLCAQSVAKKMIAQGTGGSIVFTASISGHTVNFPQPQISYNVSKAGILQLARSLGAEWARYGIRVNSISPGYMDTILNHGEGLAAARQIWISRNPIGRMGNPEELVGTVILLCSLAGRYINGADICVDGGQSVF